MIKAMNTKTKMLIIAVVFAIFVGPATYVHAEYNEAIQCLIDDVFFKEDTISFENCDYEFLPNNNLKLKNYYGDAAILTVPKEINNYNVEQVDINTFEKACNVKVVKVPTEISRKYNRNCRL